MKRTKATTCFIHEDQYTVIDLPAHLAVVPAYNLPHDALNRPRYWIRELPETVKNSAIWKSYARNIGFLVLEDEVEDFMPPLLTQKSPTPFHVGDRVKLIREGIYSFHNLYDGVQGTIIEVVPPGSHIPGYGRNDLGQLWYRLSFPIYCINELKEQVNMVSRNGYEVIKGRTGRNLRKIVPAQNPLRK